VAWSKCAVTFSQSVFLRGSERFSERRGGRCFTPLQRGETTRGIATRGGERGGNRKAEKKLNSIKNQGQACWARVGKSAFFIKGLKAFNVEERGKLAGGKKNRGRVCDGNLHTARFKTMSPAKGRPGKASIFIVHIRAGRGKIKYAGVLDSNGTLGGSRDSVRVSHELKNASNFAHGFSLGGGRHWGGALMNKEKRFVERSRNWKAKKKRLPIFRGVNSRL